MFTQQTAALRKLAPAGLKRAARTASARWRELVTYARALRGEPRDRVKVVIFGQGRTGSSLLENLIASSGHFRASGEVFANEATSTRSAYTYLRGLSLQRPHENFICHIKPHHLTEERVAAGRRAIDLNEFLKRLSRDGWRIIYLHRQDRLRHVLSNLIREVRGKPHKFNDSEEALKLVVNRESLKDLLDLRARSSEEERHGLAGLDYHEVIYERDLQDNSKHQQVIDGILNFLSLEPRPVKTQFRRINVKTLQETVANFGEFSGWAREFGMAASLDEEAPTPMAHKDLEPSSPMPATEGDKPASIH